MRQKKDKALVVRLRDETIHHLSVPGLGRTLCREDMRGRTAVWGTRLRSPNVVVTCLECIALDEFWTRHV